MLEIDQKVNKLFTVLLAVACAAIALIWPEWRTTLKAQGYSTVTSSLAGYYLLDQDADQYDTDINGDGVVDLLANNSANGLRFKVDGGEELSIEFDESLLINKVVINHEDFVAALQSPLLNLIAQGKVPADTTLTVRPDMTKTTYLDDGSRSSDIPAIVLQTESGSVLEAIGATWVYVEYCNVYLYTFSDSDLTFQIVLTDTSSSATITADSDKKVYGTAGANSITLESGAKAELINFPGSNTITIEADSSLFTVSRSGTTVTFEGADGTVLKMPSTTDVQTIIFDDITLYLKIENNQVMLGSQKVNLTPTAIETGVASVALNVEKFGQGTISDDTSGMNCSEANCTTLYNLDQVVQLSASPESGWQFNQWSGCDSVSNNICIVTMRKEKMVFATFERTAPPVLKNNVIILSSETVSQITSIQDGAIIFSSDATDIAKVPVGTILVSTVGEGFARKVTDVIALQGSTTTIATTNVPLDEIIGEGTLIFNSPLTNNDLSSVKSVKGIALRKSAQAMSPTITFDVDVDVDNDVHVKGAVELQIVPDFALDIGWTGVQEFKTAAQLTVKPSLSASVVVKSSDEKKLKREISLPISLKFAPIILGPVVLVPNVDALLSIC